MNANEPFNHRPYVAAVFLLIGLLWLCVVAASNMLWP